MPLTAAEQTLANRGQVILDTAEKRNGEMFRGRTANAEMRKKAEVRGQKQCMLT